MVKFDEQTSFSKSLRILKRDKRFARLIKKHGVPDLKHGGNSFQSLVRSIIHQQVSGAAAATILKRFEALFPGKRFPTPIDVRMTPPAKLRSAGLSAQKTSYIRDLAEKFSNGTIEHRALHKLTNNEIIAHLTQVEGIGVWTAHMFLIFTLNRPNILPTGDLGIRKGFQIVYKLRTLPTHAHMEKLALPWRAHASVASWYLWRVADEGRVKKA